MNRRRPRCPSCRNAIRLFDLTPLLLPEIHPLHTHIYNRLRCDRNDSSHFHYQRALLMIYGQGANEIPLDIPRPVDYYGVMLNVNPRR